MFIALYFWNVNSFWWFITSMKKTFCVKTQQLHYWQSAILPGYNQLLNLLSIFVSFCCWVPFKTTMLSSPVKVQHAIKLWKGTAGQLTGLAVNLFNMLSTFPLAWIGLCMKKADLWDIYAISFTFFSCAIVCSNVAISAVFLAS